MDFPLGPNKKFWFTVMYCNVLKRDCSGQQTETDNEDSLEQPEEDQPKKKTEDHLPLL